MAKQFDVLILGSGAAGLTLALNLPSNLRVAVLSKGRLEHGATWWAQGGIAGVFEKSDTTEAHAQDTYIAGANLSHRDSVDQTVKHGPDSIRWLIDQGVPFTFRRRLSPHTRRRPLPSTYSACC
jgi:L-aspartate oxidase